MGQMRGMRRASLDLRDPSWHGRRMFEGMTLMALTTLIAVVIGAVVIVSLAVSRRTAAQWQSHLRSQADRWNREVDQGIVYDEVQPTDVSFEAMFSARATSGSAYVDPETIPGAQRLEHAAERIENMRHAHAHRS